MMKQNEENSQKKGQELSNEDLENVNGGRGGKRRIDP